MMSATSPRVLYRKHLPQCKLRMDQTRHRFCLAGRRGGKTEYVKEDILENLPLAPRGGEIFYIGPTNQQAKELMWEKIEERVEQLGWRCKPNVSNQIFHFSNRRKLYIIGAEKIRRIRGHKVFRLYCDEVAFFTTPLTEVWRAARPALSDLKGRALFATTPNGKGTDAYDFYLDIMAKKQEWAYHYWTSLQNPFLDPEEISRARYELDEKSFRQEYEASWETFEGLAYYNFNENLHIKAQPGIDFSIPLDLLWDFNVNPTTLLLAQREPVVDHNQRVRPMLRFKKEYSFKDSSTERTIKAFCDEFQQHKEFLRLRIFGDSAGDNRHSTTGRTDYDYIKEMLKKYGYRFEMCVPGVNPAIIDRVNWMNSWLRNTMDEHRIEIDPTCKDLIRDLASQILEGRHPSDKNNLGHKADAAGYYVTWNHLMDTRRPSSTIIL